MQFARTLQYDYRTDFSGNLFQVTTIAELKMFNLNS